MAPEPTFGYQRAIAAISLVVGPLVMSIGDLLHPQESLDAAEQAAVIIQQASRWYAAHLLLLIGLLLSIPGFLVLAGLTARRKPWAGYAARILVLIGVASFTPIFVTEMFIGRLIMNGASPEQAVGLLETFESPWIFVAAIFLITEILAAQVLSSQIANILLLVGGAAFSWRLLRTNDFLVEGPADQSW
jgi:hypothetical protein